MTKLLTSLKLTITTGFILTIAFIFYFLTLGNNIDIYFWQFLFRYIHVLASTMWIGLLWYFNFVQIPNMPKIPDDQNLPLVK